MKKKKKKIYKKLIINNTSSNINIIKDLMDKVKVKEKVINDIKLNILLEIKSGEKMLSVVFIYNDKDIYYYMTCKNTDQFSKI